MNDHEVISHLLDIKERLSVVETKVDIVVAQEPRITHIENELTQVKTEYKTIKKISYFLLISVPATVAAAVKVWK
jgi:hypothetical protein